MAAARCTTLSSLTPSVNPTTATRTKPFAWAYLPKPTKRKNYLRPKILKTLTKPSPNPVIPIISPEIKTETEAETPPEPHLDFEYPTEQISGEKRAADPGEGDKVEEFRVSETLAGYDGIFGKFSAGSVLKYGAYLVGIFVFQTICTVWILGSANSHRKERNLDNSDSGFRENNKGNFFLNKNGIRSGASNVVLAHDSELERKIEEIRAMAREARKSEAKVEEEDDEDNDDIGEESVIPKHRVGIEKEMSATLSNLQKRLNSVPEKLPGSYVNYLGKPGKVEDRENRDNLDSKGANGDLMFKKKFKFRSPSTTQIDGPKGFQGTGDRNMSNTKKSSSDSVERIRGNGTVGVELLGLEKQVERRHGDKPESNYGTLGEDDGMMSLMHDLTSLAIDGKVLKEERQGSDLGIEMRVGNAERRNGVVQEPSIERPSVEVVNLQQSVKLGSQHSQRFRNGNQETTTTSDKHAVFNRNGGSKHREVGDELQANKFREKQPNIGTDFWWLSLPYVLAILMRRGSDLKGQVGLYTLKIGSQAQEQSNSSYTVAFEDRVDANNFCFLLEAFLKDLGDFSADIVPLSIKELHEAVKANTMKVIVVKKRQLQLYADQPFADVEMALHSLVKGDQNASMPNSR